MPAYEMWFQHSISLDERLREGDAYRYRGDVWRVDRVEDDSVFLVLWGERHGPYPERIHGESA